MKQLALVSLTALALFGLFTTAISSEDSGTVEVKVQPQVVVSITIPAGDQIVDFGELALSMDNDSRTTEDSNALSVMNLGSTPVDLSIEASNAMAALEGEADWNLSCVDQGAATEFRGVVDDNQFALRYLPNDSADWGGSLAQALCPDDGKTLAQDVQAGNGQAVFMLQMNMPTGTDGYSQRTSTVTITATAQ